MRPPFQFIPGWALGGGPWRETLADLGAEPLELPGYGRSAPAEDFFSAATRLAQALPAGAVLGGWSLGALVALAIATTVPTKVSRLILVAGTASFVRRAGWPAGLEAAVLRQFATAVAADPDTAVARFVKGFNHGDRHDRRVTRSLLQTADPLPSQAVLLQGLAWLETVDLRPLLPQLTVPTLICHGAHDPLMPLAAAETLAAAVPDCRLAVFADAAHAPFLSDPPAFCARIRDFVDDPSA